MRYQVHRVDCLDRTRPTHRTIARTHTQTVDGIPLSIDKRAIHESNENRRISKWTEIDREPDKRRRPYKTDKA